MTDPRNAEPAKRTLPGIVGAGRAEDVSADDLTGRREGGARAAAQESPEEWCHSGPPRASGAQAAARSRPCGPSVAKQRMSSCACRRVPTPR